MASIVCTDYLTYLRNTRKLAPSTIANYEMAFTRLRIPKFSTNDLPRLWKYMFDYLPVYDPETNALVRPGYYGYVYLMTAFVKDALGTYDVKPIGVEYHTLIDTLKTLKFKVDAYTLEQLKQLLAGARSRPKSGLYRLLIFMTYSGCRPGSCNLKLSEFFEIKEVPNLLGVKTIGKRIPYTAIIPRHVFEHIQEHNFSKTDYLTDYREFMQSDFSHYNRTKLQEVMKSLNFEKGKTDAFRSVRKFYANKLSTDEVPGENISLLLGHIPQKSNAFKYYIDERTVRAAKAYAQTSFMQWRAWN